MIVTGIPNSPLPKNPSARKLEEFIADTQDVLTDAIREYNSTDDVRKRWHLTGRIRARRSILEKLQTLLKARLKEDERRKSQV